MSTSIRENIDRLLNTELDRADFLKLCGIAVIAAVGVGGMLKAMAASQPNNKQVAQQPVKRESRAFGE